MIREWRRLKKRVLMVTAIVVVVVLSAGGLLGWYAASLPGPADMTRFIIHGPENRQHVIGAGISLRSLHSTNMVADPSFEPVLIRTALTVHQTNGDTLSVASQDVDSDLYHDGFFNGAKARVMSWNQDNMTVKKSAMVTSYGINRISSIQGTAQPEEVGSRVKINALLSVNNSVWAVGDQGLVILNAGSSEAKVIQLQTREDLTGIEYHSGTGFFVCSRQGSVFYSENGEIWNRLQAQAEQPLNSIAVNDKGFFVAAGDNGLVLAGSPRTKAVSFYLETQADLNAVIFNGSEFYTAGENGVIFSSSGGLIWRQVSADSTSDWHVIRSHGDQVYLAGEHGRFAHIDNENKFQMLPALLNSNTIDFFVLSSEQLMALDREGLFYISNNAGHDWQQITEQADFHSSAFIITDENRLISAGRTGQIGTAVLTTEIVLDSPAAESGVQTGDIIFLEKSILEFQPFSLFQTSMDVHANNEPFWYSHGSGEFYRSERAVPQGGGNASLAIDRTRTVDQHPAILSQEITAISRQQTRNEIFHLEAWLKHEDDSSGSLKVWLSGPFEPQGIQFEFISNDWKRYTYSFVMPPFRLSDNDSVYLNLSYDGDGIMFVDRTYLGKAAELPDSVAREQLEMIKDADPAILRFENLGIGSRLTGQQSWALPQGNENISSINKREKYQANIHSLHTALSTAQSSNADPWLVIDSYMSIAEAFLLVEYLSAPITEPYGRKRQQNGSILPWTEQFSRIYLEITDRNDIFEMDAMRASYVNTIIETVVNSPFYARYKQQFVFIDGMKYDQGIMLSAADYYAADMILIHDDQDPEYNARRTLEQYYHHLPRIPDRPVTGALSLNRASIYDKHEMLPDLAWLVHVLMADIGDQTALTNMNVDFSQSSDSGLKRDLAAVSILSHAVKGLPLEIQKIDISSDTKSQPVNDPDQLQAKAVAAYAFYQTDQIVIVLTNYSNERHDVQIVTDLSLQDASIKKYQADGGVLSSQRMRRQNQKITMMPGSVAIITSYHE